MIPLAASTLLFAVLWLRLHLYPEKRPTPLRYEAERMRTLLERAQRERAALAEEHDQAHADLKDAHDRLKNLRAAYSDALAAISKWQKVAGDAKDTRPVGDGWALTDRRVHSQKGAQTEYQQIETCWSRPVA